MGFFEWLGYVSKEVYEEEREKRIALEERVLELEKQIEELKKENTKEVNELEGDFWERIQGWAENQISKELYLLNPSKKYEFLIENVTDDYISVDKIYQIELTKELFETLIDYLKKKDDWVPIGASRTNTRPDTVEGVIKQAIFDGDMNATSTASWVSAILVYSLKEIEFNDKARGQAIRYTRK